MAGLQQDIRTMKQDSKEVKEEVGNVSARMVSLEGHMDRKFAAQQHEIDRNKLQWAGLSDEMQQLDRHRREHREACRRIRVQDPTLLHVYHAEGPPGAKQYLGNWLSAYKVLPGEVSIGSFLDEASVFVTPADPSILIIKTRDQYSRDELLRRLKLSPKRREHAQSNPKHFIAAATTYHQRRVKKLILDRLGDGVENGEYTIAMAGEYLEVRRHDQPRKPFRFDLGVTLRTAEADCEAAVDWWDRMHQERAGRPANTAGQTSA